MNLNYVIHQYLFELVPKCIQCITRLQFIELQYTISIFLIYSLNDIAEMQPSFRYLWCNNNHIQGKYYTLQSLFSG